MNRQQLILICVIVSASSLTLAAPTTAPSIDEIRQDYDAQRYQDAVKKITIALQPRTDPLAREDWLKLLHLKAESQLRLKQNAAAADSFVAAAKETVDEKQANLDKATAALARKSPNSLYLPKQAVFKSSLGASAKPVPIDIIDPGSRKQALMAFFSDESQAMSARIEELRKQSALPPLMTAITQVNELRVVELAANGSDTASRQMISSLAVAAERLMTGSIETMLDNVRAISRNANKKIESSRAGSGEGTMERDRKGLSLAETDALNEILANCISILAACDDLARGMPVETAQPSGGRRSSTKGPAADLAGVKSDAKDLAQRAADMLQGDYAAGTLGQEQRAPRRVINVPHFLSTRQRQEEWMDGPAVDPQILARSLKFIRIINSLLGYTRATLGHFKRFSREWKPGQRITILDVATGSADIPRGILRWSEDAGFDVRIVGIDRHAATSAIAAEQSRAETAKLSIVRGNALQLPFDDASFDYAMTNMFLHHLDEEAIVQVLREMDRVARRGIIVADLIRNRRAYFWIKVFTLAANPMVRHDARVSVAQAFNREEVLSLRDRANIRYAEYHEHSAHRFTLAGGKPMGA